MIFKSDATYKLLSGDGIFDATYRELLQKAKQTPGFVKRADEQITAFYVKSDPDGTIHFTTPSGTQPGKYYRQRVRLSSFQALVRQHKGSKKPLQIVRMALNRNVRVGCFDPAGQNEASFQYWGFAFIGTKRGFTLPSAKEEREPDVRNPQRRGSLCKHLIQVMRILPFQAQKIARDMAKQGVFETEEE